jgi:hypothetical protein
MFIIDSSNDTPIGEPYESYDKIDMAFAGKITMDDEPTTDEWGSYYSAFAPIYGKSGEVIAIIGIIIGICVSNKDITGSYEILIIDTLGEIEELGKLYVYENNECLIETVFKKDKYHKSYNECTYNILEDTITFKYRSNNKESYYTDTCTIEDGAFNCPSLANIVPRRSYDLWVRFD